jgi:hypothetical protein
LNEFKFIGLLIFTPVIWLQSSAIDFCLSDNAESLIYDREALFLISTFHFPMTKTHGQNDISDSAEDLDANGDRIPKRQREDVYPEVSHRTTVPIEVITFEAGLAAVLRQVIEQECQPGGVISRPYTIN